MKSLPSGEKRRDIGWLTLAISVSAKPPGRVVAPAGTAAQAAAMRADAAAANHAPVRRRTTLLLGLVVEVELAARDERVRRGRAVPHQLDRRLGGARLRGPQADADALSGRELDRG